VSGISCAFSILLLPNDVLYIGGFGARNQGAVKELDEVLGIREDQGPFSGGNRRVLL
jgi:hypothetical protein